VRSPQAYMEPASTSTLGLNVRSVFGDSSADPIYVTDSRDLGGWLKEAGLRTALFEDFVGAPETGVVLIPTDWDRFPRPSRLREQLMGHRVLWVPIASFDGASQTARYSMSLLFRSDFKEAVPNNKRVMLKLLPPHRERAFRAEGTELAFMLEEDVYVNSRTRLHLEEGEQASIGAYFEAELGANWVDKEETFHVNGHMRVSGVLASHHRELPAELGSKVAEASELLAELRSLLPFTIEIRDSHVAAGSFGHLDEAMRELTNPMYDGLLTELAFGTNTALNPHVDWSHNSQFNESVGGLHIALGDGLTGSHIDFVCPDGELLA